MAKRYGGRSTAGLIFRIIFIIFIVGVNGIILWRVFSSGDPKSMDTIVPDKTIVDIYNRDGTLDMWYQEQNNITKGDNNYGYFSVTDWYYIEKANEIQLTFRYNNSTIKHLVEDYDLEKTPDRAENLYDVTLLVAYDLTPDDTTDNDSNDPESVKFVRYYPNTNVGSKTKNVYNYRKYCFEGIEINDSVLAVYADFYYVGDINYDEEAYGTLILYDYASKNITRKLTNDDIKAMEN